MKVFVCLLALAASASAGYLGGLAPHGGVIAGANGLHTITIQEEAPALLPAQPAFIHAQPEYKTLVQEAPAAPAFHLAAAAPAPAHAIQYLSAAAPAPAVHAAAAPAYSFLQGGAVGLPAGLEFLSGAVGTVGSAAVNVLPAAAHSVGVAPSVQVIQAAPAPAIHVAQPEFKTIQVAHQPEYKTIQLLQPAAHAKTFVQEAFPAEHKTIIQGGHEHHAKFLQYLKK